MLHYNNLTRYSAMIYTDKITEIFCSIDDFCKTFLPIWNQRLISNGKKRNKPSKLSLSEVMTIQVIFHLSSHRNFKDFYYGYVKKHLKKEFPNLVSYNRMVELKQQSFIPLATYLKSSALGDCTGISFVDSTPLRVCHSRRINQHKTFEGLAERGQCSIGWFYGFKLHIVT